MQREYDHQLLVDDDTSVTDKRAEAKHIVVPPVYSMKVLSQSASPANDLTKKRI